MQMPEKRPRSEITLFLCGDVMTGRGLDQILPHPCDPRIHEPYVKDAGRYVDIAEEKNGLIPQPADFSYIWGDALEELDSEAPDVKIINLETSITTSDDYWKGKGINYRMNPDNIPCITTAGIDICVLANNHVLDWGYEGLSDTLRTLRNAGLKTAGAGRDIMEAESPAILEIAGRGRLIVVSFGAGSSGIPAEWAASSRRPGVNLLPDLSDKTVSHIGDIIHEEKSPGDVVVASVHWGGNWGYHICREEREFAHVLIDLAGTDIVHGHSSHHVKGIEIYRDKPIIYGCGDFINDYEGISGYESFRGDLSLMYFVRMDTATGKIAGLRMAPMQMRRFKVNRVSRNDAIWLMDTLNREGRYFGTRVSMNKENNLELSWNHKLN
ncbi:MAG TPA: CapA family protein [Geobacteraceae bacterium]|nr:CapA family protein [Geobacteraceae bacterium]